MNLASHTHRLARAADLPAIVAIYNETIPLRLVTADLEAVSVASRRAWFADHQRASRPLWVVEQDGEPAAWLSFSSFYGRPAYAGTAEVSVYVAGRARRRGIAAYLLHSAAAAAPQLGLHTLLGFIFGHNRPSLALFGRFGYETWGRLPRVATLDGIERDLVIVGRRIGAAAGAALPQ
jgi:phosphinothricin acetyltransferase